jgi:hypothetical protein
MSDYTITQRQVKNLFEKCSTLKGEEDLKKLFDKYFKDALSDKPKKDKSKDKSEKKQKDKSKNKSEKKVDGFKIVEISGNLQYPSSKYKKETPKEASESALAGILRKNKNLDKKTAKFSFTIQSGDGPKYSYTYSSGKLTKGNKINDSSDSDSD